MGVKYPEEFLAKLRAVTGKRPKTVIDHILKHGQITTEKLKELYGYDHPPRAIKDVTDLGIPIERLKAKAKNGRTIAAYRFAGPATVRGGTYTGRVLFPKKFKQQLIDRDGKKCALCYAEFDAAFLQIDHRIPYGIAGQAPGDLRLEDYMLVCRSCNRAKSWSCEHCPNWIAGKKPKVCQSRFWCQPGDYEPVATVQVRRLNLAWREEEVREYDQLLALSRKAQAEMPEFVKAILRKHIEKAQPPS